MKRQRYGALGDVFGNREIAYAGAQLFADEGLQVYRRKVVVVPDAITFHDIPFTKEFHVDERAYHRGRSRVMFYKKYMKWKILFINARVWLRAEVDLKYR